MQLNRDVSGKDTTWKYNYAPCNQGNAPAGFDCDEYPYLSATQGGGAAQPIPNLQYVDSTQNRLAGTRLNQFYTACNLPAGSNTAFLVVPLPYDLNVNTGWAPADSQPTLLSEAPLKELERRWREQDEIIASALRVGLDDSAIDALTKPLGFRLPAEARVLGSGTMALIRRVAAKQRRSAQAPWSSCRVPGCRRVRDDAHDRGDGLE